MPTTLSDFLYPYFSIRDKKIEKGWYFEYPPSSINVNGQISLISQMSVALLNLLFNKIPFKIENGDSDEVIITSGREINFLQ